MDLLLKPLKPRSLHVIEKAYLNSLMPHAGQGANNLTPKLRCKWGKHLADARAPSTTQPPGSWISESYERAETY